MLFRFTRALTLLALLSACARSPRPGRPTAIKSDKSQSVNKYSDETIRQLATWQDERNAAALLPYLTNARADYRREAALAFASVQEKTAVPFLLPLLRDTVASVRRAAAYAVGQAGDSLAVDSLRVRVLKEPDALVRRYVQEALGRCVTRRTLPELWRVETLSDTARAAALAWGLSRAALRGLSSAESIRRTVLAINTPGLSGPARLAAATALARTRGLDADLNRLAGATLLRLAAKDRYYAVRAAGATALGKIASTNKGAATLLIRLATKDDDYRVRVAALRALPAAGEAYAGSRAAVFSALTDSEAPVALTAAEWLLAHGRGETGAALDQKASSLKPWRVRATLTAAALKLASPASQPSIVTAVEKRYAAAASGYEKGHWLQALGEAPAAFDFLLQETFAPGQWPVVAGYGLQALVSLRRGALPAARNADFAALMRQALATGNVALLSIAAETLADARLYPEAQPADLASLHQAQAKLQLPRDIEAWQSIQTALDRLEKAPRPTPVPLGTAQQYPLDWRVVQAIPANQRVRLRTTRGDIVLELQVNDAPGSVANFVELVRHKFYNGLYFHRVVPNFVAQGGDPHGDGSGSLPYALRSEFGDLGYREGSVGLASSGKDTESCQFFITHTVVPHLDGRYTIFAYVVEGMEIVHKLEISDQILGIDLIDNL